MYLSRLTLNPRNRRVQRELANPYELHRTLMRAFPDDLKKGKERVLFRQEPGRDGGLTLLVQSWTRPDWSYLAGAEFRDYLLQLGGPNPAVKSFDLDLGAGQVLAFRLRANPTVKRTFVEKGKKKKRRVGLYREEEQIAWLERKGAHGGFRPLSVRTGGQETVGGWDKERHKLKLLAVQFDGLLRVTDPQQLRHTVRQGIGSGKGLGFGLLSLAPPP